MRRAPFLAQIEAGGDIYFLSLTRVFDQQSDNFLPPHILGLSWCHMALFKLLYKEVKL